MKERGSSGAARPSLRAFAAPKVLAAILLAVVAPLTATAQPAYRVKDIIAGSNGSVPRSFTDVNGTIFFRASDGVNGKELWKSDGTLAGTTMVTDICPGACSSMPDDPLYDTFMVNVNGTLFFAANNNVNGAELWKSDGTPAGTVIVKDIRPGTTGSLGTNGALLSRAFKDVNGTLFFLADDGTTGLELWKSDGSAAGTVLVKDIAAGATSSIPNGLEDLFAFNGTVLFAASDLGGAGFELWRSDGTAAGTFLVKDIAPNFSFPSSYPNAFVDLGGGVALFVADTTGVAGRELYRTDGTAAGTSLVKDIYPGPFDSLYGYPLVAMNGIAYFMAADQASPLSCPTFLDDAELWQSDGTLGGTFRVLDINPGLCASGPQDLQVAGTRIFFQAHDGVHGYEPWITDGSPGGTTLLKDANPGLPSGIPLTNQAVFASSGGTVFFRATDGINGNELWTSDGTPAGTFMLDDVSPGPSSSNPNWLATTAGHLFFGATDTPTGNEVWAVPLVPTILAAQVSVTEGSAGPVPVPVPVFVYPPPTSTVTVNFATADGTANSSDYTPTTGSLTFVPGSSVQTFPVTINGDATPEANETFLVNLSGASGAPVAVSQGVTTILNDDGPGISVADVPAQIESGLAQFFVTLSATSTDTITVDYATANGTAQGPGDYTPASGTLTFLPGQTFKSVNVTITSDTQDEPNEDFFLNLSNPVFAFIADGQGVCTIIDDDPSPNLSVNNVSLTEPNPPASQNMSFTVNLSAASGQVVTVDYATSDGTASAGSDYGAVSGTVTIAPGSLTATIPVAIIGDNVDEPNETLNMNLTNPTNAGISDGLGLGTINDNDTTNITIGNVTVTEGNPPGTTAANFTVTLSVPFYLPLTIDYATAPGTTNPATPGTDYTSASGTLSFAPGTTTQTITVDVLRELLDEPTAAETFFVNLSNNSGGTITDAQGQGSITDDDVSHVLITDVSQFEGDTGTTPFVFALTLDGPSVNQITLHYATANGTATAGTDYMATSGPLSFAAGETTTTPVTVLVNGDTTSEADETFHVNLSAITGTQGTTAGPATGTIQNDDTPGFSIGNATLTEGNANMTFTVTLQGTIAGTPSVDFATADGTAVQPGDYTTSSGTLTFTAGVSTRTLTVPIVSDTIDEPNETFFVNLSNPMGGPVINNGQGIGTINDNDTTIISILDVTLAENVAGGLANVSVRFSVPYYQDVTLDYATADGTAAAPGDYTVASGTLTLLSGTTATTLSVPIVDDTLDEPVTPENFLVNLSNSSGPALTDAQGKVNITDNDASTLAVADVSTLEGDTGATPMTFTVTLGGGKTNDVTVSYITCDPGPPANPPGCVAGTATQGVDFVPASGSLSFPACTAEPCPPQSLSQTVTVDLVGDTNVEPNETFNLYLTNAVGTTISDNHGQGTILNDDGTPTISVDDTDVVEPVAGNAIAAFTVTLLPPSAGAITVNFATANGSAIAPNDYTAASGLLSFAAGNTSKTVNVTVRPDATAEVPETFSVNLSNPTGGAVIGDGTGTGTIVDRSFSLDELDHGSRVVTDLLPPALTLPDEDRYRISQAPRSSYEAVVDALSGDALPVELDLLGSDNSTVVVSGTPVAGGGAMSLRFENAAATAIMNQRIRVRTGVGGCGTNCDAQDVYRIRAWDTTYRVARYNNSSTQVTILVIQNPTDATVDGNVWFWSGATGTLNGSVPFTVPAKGVLSLNTASVAGVAGTSGALTVTHNASYGALIGKAVSVETATGFTFDTPLESRAR